MLVVLGGRDVEADVVEQRGELEQLAVGVGQAVQRPQAAEEIERQAGDVLGVRLVGVAAAGQAHHRAAAQIGVLVDELDARARCAPRSRRPGPSRSAASHKT